VKAQESVTSLVRSLLSVRGPKQVELARKIGMSEASMSHIMSPSKTRQRAWQIHEVRAIAEYYGISTDALLGDATAREKVLKKLRDEAAKRVNATD
jgi:antitoxin component HigA of HigAB toxin-antitoxin module